MTLLVRRTRSPQQGQQDIGHLYAGQGFRYREGCQRCYFEQPSTQLLLWLRRQAPEQGRRCTWVSNFHEELSALKLNFR